MIPHGVHIQGGSLPDRPGVYRFYDRSRRILYVGKASSLHRRVHSHFARRNDPRHAEWVSRVARVAYHETRNVLEALVLEANTIKRLQPRFNVREKDDRSFLFLCVTRETYPRPVLLRGNELARKGIEPMRARSSREYQRIFGPYTSAKALRVALDLVRKIVPWSTCAPATRRPRPCFYRELFLCPGVCTGEISPEAYRALIGRLLWFFEGRYGRLRADLTNEMTRLARSLEFEKAQRIKKQIFSLEHVQDVALVEKDPGDIPSSAFARVEAFDISHLSGEAAVGSMAVFECGVPEKSHYRRFRIKTVSGVNDVGMLAEVLGRRLRRALRQPLDWPLPDLLLIDGGRAQVRCVEGVARELGFKIPVVGMAKGRDRKQDRLVFGVRVSREHAKKIRREKPMLTAARDEAHRFAIFYHRKLRRRRGAG
jgi:excinuclease ABC subunit C